MQQKAQPKKVVMWNGMDSSRTEEECKVHPLMAGCDVTTEVDRHGFRPF